MSKPQPNYAIIRYSGKVENLRAATYLDALDWVYEDVSSGGSRHDRPLALLRNGTIVVREHLWDLAYDYVKYRRKQWDDAARNTEQRWVEGFATEYAG